ncbi:expressed unknown protein [Seminavis robusta]|uniref:Uncharacterized protein n=1 Tax=Seminavis robusta TaxID=568900 RepID=A0A9N8DXY5_9STRA|nr:expressed unknown protein [Seminavis robusta]|eukprot:Sro453_g146010.1 n/a (555) ;mRNA; f:8708-10372
MVRLKKLQRRPLLRKRRQADPIISSSGSPKGRRWFALTPLNCLACVCLFLNVLVLSLTLMINRRLKQKGNVVPNQTPPPERISSSVATVAAAKGDFKISSSHGASNYLVPPAKVKESPTPLHIVFHTDCRDPTQDWQAYVLFYGIYKMKQPGEVTRVISGCQQEGRKMSLETTHKTQIEPMGVLASGSASRFHVHFAPAHPHQAEIGSLRKHMKYFNRPFGIYHWMEHVLGYSEQKPNNAHDGTVIIVMDCDMIVMRPLTADFGMEELWKKQLNPQLQGQPQRVQPGHPMAQHTAFPSQWWNELEVGTVSSPAIQPGLTKLQQMLRSDVDNHYATGLPILAAASDFYPLVQKWSAVAFPLFEALQEKILREPHGPYALAAAELQKPHQLAESFSIQGHKEPGFGLLEAHFSGYEGAALLSRPDAQCRQTPVELKPHILQYSKRYGLGNFIIGKHYMPKNFMGTMDACDQPLYAEPPDNIAELFRYYMDPELKQRVEIEKEMHILQMSVMLCEIIQAFNEAATNWKQRHCTQARVNIDKQLQFEDGEPPKSRRER